MDTFADLHIHSQHSDSTLTVEEIFQQAQLAGVGLIAVSDHNVLGGTREACKFSENHQIQAISAVELDALYGDLRLHILAYGFDLNSCEFASFVKKSEDMTEKNHLDLIEKMALDYPQITMEDFLRFPYEGQHGGWKTLEYFIHKGLIKNQLEGVPFYKKYNTYYKIDFPALAEVLFHIAQAGGLSVLAHPGRVLKTPDMEGFKTLLEDLLDQGIDGIECYYPTHSPSVTAACLAACKARKLLITSGSDCHGTFEDATIGQLKIKTSDLNLGRLTP